jgi:hypothetical protein
MLHLLKGMHMLLLSSTCMFKARLLLQVFRLCYFLHLLLMNMMLYVTHTMLIIFSCLLKKSAHN